MQEYFAHDLLKSKFNASIIGQHIAFKQILEATSEASHGNQILVFGLIGSPGTGKSLLSQLLVQTFMQRVHQVQSVADLNDNLIQNLLRTCSSDLVVIDNSVVSTFDLRKVQLFIDRLKRNKIQTKRTFLVLTTTILDFQQFSKLLEWTKAGVARTSWQINQVIEGGIFRDYMNIFMPENIVFVPFMPLTRHHVLQCIRKEIKLQKGALLFPEDYQTITDQMEFYSQSFPVFANGGCKHVKTKVQQLLMNVAE